MLNSNKSHAALFVVGMVIFTIIGLLFGSESAISADSFGDYLRAYSSDPQARAIFVAILVDVATGIMAAMRLGVFNVQQSAKFYMTNVLPYVLGFLLVWTLAYFGIEQDATIRNTLGAMGYGIIMTALGGSIFDNIKRARLGSSTPEDVSMREKPIDNAEG